MTGSANGAFDSLMPSGAFCALLNLFVQVIFGCYIKLIQHDILGHIDFYFLLQTWGVGTFQSTGV